MDPFSSAVARRYEKILRENPRSPAFCPLAQIYRMRKETDSAERLCLQGLKHHPRHYGGHIVLARIYKDKDRPQEALRRLSRAKGLDPENPAAYRLAGEIYLQQKNTAAALQAYKMVLFLNPWDRFAAQIIREAAPAEALNDSRQAAASRAAGAGSADEGAASEDQEALKKGAVSKESSFLGEFPWDPFFFEKERARERKEINQAPQSRRRGLPERAPPAPSGESAAPEGLSLGGFSKRRRLRVLQKLLSYIERRAAEKTGDPA